MQATILFNLRGLHQDEALRYASWFYEQRFWSILGQRNRGWALFYEFQTFFNEVIEMAKGSKSSNDRSTHTNFGSVTWINVALSDENLQELETWLHSDPDILTEVIGIIASGFSLAVKPASEGNGYMATIIGPSRENPALACGVSGYGSTPFDALAAVLYKFIVRLDAGFTPGSASTTRRFR